jgi:signal transduction histidine kinase/ligand-binding sensor domain-containing protein
MKWRLCCTVFLLLFSFVINAQPAFNFKLFTHANGLVNNDVKVISKDYEGYYWLGTNNGLSRYDGSFFKNYTAVSNTSLWNNNIIDITTTAKGYNYYITEIGPSIFNTATKILEKIRHNPTLKKGWGHNFTDADGIVWMSNFLSVCSYKILPNAQLELIHNYTETKNSTTWHISQAWHKNIFVCNEELGLQMINPFTNKVTAIPLLYHTTLKKYYKTNALYNINWQNDSIGWGHYNNTELLKINIANKTCASVSILNKNGIKTNCSNPSIIRIPNSNLTIGIAVTGRGLLLVDANTLKIVKEYNTDENVNVTEALQNINYLYFDDKNCLLLGTAFGLLKADWQSKLLSTVVLPPLLINKELSTTYKDSEKNSWYATKDGMLICADSAGKIVLNTKLQTTAYATCIRQIKNEIYIGTNIEKLYSIVLNKKVLVEKSIAKNATYSIKNLKDIQALNDSVILLLNFYKGIVAINNKNTILPQYSFLVNKELNTKQFFTCMQIDKNKHVWLGLMFDGYFDCNMQKHSAVYYLPDTSFNDPLINYTNAITYDGNEYMYIATNNGLIKHGITIGLKQNIYNKNTDNYFFYTKLINGAFLNATKTSINVSNFQNNNLNSLLNDEVQLKVQEQSILPFYMPNEFGILKNNVLKTINYNYTGQPLVVNNIIINEINTQLNNRKVFSVEETKQGKYAFSTTSKDNNITIEIGFPNQPLTNEAKISYAIDNENFTYVSGNIINLNSLSWGKHKIIVKVDIANYTLAKNFINLTITVARPWYLQWWFIAIVFIIGIWYLTTYIKKLNKKVASEKTLNQFATSLYKLNTVSEVFWEIASNVTAKLGFKDCELFLVDHNTKKCTLVAAHGLKNVQGTKILNPLVINIEQKSIVAKVARTGKGIFLPDTNTDSDFMEDSEVKRSEICIPILVDGKVFAIVNCEDAKRNYFSKTDYNLLQKIADISSLKITKYIVQQNIREEIARDLHDDIGGTLQSISLQTTLAEMQLGNSTIDTKNSLQKIGHTSRAMIERMNDIIWSINPNNDGWDNYYKRAKNYAAEILSQNNIKLEMAESITYPETMRLNLEDRKNLYLFFKEAINNAAKYSKADKVVIAISIEEKTMILKIKDDGCGFEIEKNPIKASGGNGLQNLNQRATLLNGSLEIVTAINKGTEIILHFEGT